MLAQYLSAPGNDRRYQQDDNVSDQRWIFYERVNVYGIHGVRLAVGPAPPAPSLFVPENANPEARPGPRAECPSAEINSGVWSGSP
ncbi:hypothetical protein EVAR_54362_1 [Eumeta japonica]|uniref:Uncharacterized protein n=1 Tax=Eumeta variegata TaxID=151549 RepID=A0A4C1Z9Q3_EUMVA|nr:hypothetical protein EVAR_54362_1 [Eumeta japonica]